MLKRVCAITALLLGTVSFGMGTEGNQIRVGLDSDGQPLTLERASNPRGYYTSDLLEKKAKSGTQERAALDALYEKLCQPGFNVGEDGAQLPRFDDELDSPYLRNTLGLIESKSTLHGFNFPAALLKMLGNQSQPACKLMAALLEHIPLGFTSSTKWYNQVMRLLEQLPEEEQTPQNLTQFKEWFVMDLAKLGEGHEKTRLRMFRDALDLMEASDRDVCLNMENVRSIFDSDVDSWTSFKGKLDVLPANIASATGRIKGTLSTENLKTTGRFLAQTLKSPGDTVTGLPFFLVVAVSGAPCHGHKK